MKKHYWNYRVLVKFYDGTPEFHIHEVYYENDIPVSCTENPISVGGDSIKSLNWTLNKMKLALKKPILHYDRFPEEYINLKE